MRDIFTGIYKTNFWRDKESASGTGSNLRQTKAIRMVIPPVFTELKIGSMLDIPCGDFYWFSHIKGIENVSYIGADIVTELIYENNLKYPSNTFIELDATTDQLPKVDLILCRDMLGHFTNANVVRTLKNFRASGSKYLLATTFPGRNANVDLDFDGQWRPIDLEALRYGLGPAGLLLNEGCTEGKGRFSDKSLGLWKL